MVFEPGDWVWMPGEYNSDSTINIADFSLCFAGSGLRTNPFGEEEYDAIMIGV